MIDPSLPLQAALFAALAAEFADKAAGVFDRVPLDSTGAIAATAFPFVHIGDDEITSDADQCHDAMTAHATVHVYSRAPGKVEAKRIMARVCAALDVNLDVAGFGVVTRKVERGPRHMTDTDGLTSHSVVTFLYRMAPAA